MPQVSDSPSVAQSGYAHYNRLAAIPVGYETSLQQQRVASAYISRPRTSTHSHGGSLRWAITTSTRLHTMAAIRCSARRGTAQTMP